MTSLSQLFSLSAVVTLRSQPVPQSLAQRADEIASEAATNDSLLPSSSGGHDIASKTSASSNVRQTRTPQRKDTAAVNQTTQQQHQQQQGQGSRTNAERVARVKMIAVATGRLRLRSTVSLPMSLRAAYTASDARDRDGNGVPIAAVALSVQFRVVAFFSSAGYLVLHYTRVAVSARSSKARNAGSSRHLTDVGLPVVRMVPWLVVCMSRACCHCCIVSVLDLLMCG